MSHRIPGLPAMLVVTLVLAAVAAPASSQVVIGQHVPYAAGWSLVVNTTGSPVTSAPIAITHPSSPWLKLWFDGVDLGVASKLRITGVQDEVVQVLDAEAIAAWSNTSAYFNGDSVVVELVVAPYDAASAFVAGYDTGWPSVGGEDSICGNTDDRVYSTEPRVGRLLNSSMNVLCSGGLVSSNACYLTAGHCVSGGSVFTVEFNCPPSGANGQAQHPGPEHQYPLIYGTLGSLNNGIGNDWALARLANNTSTGLSPALIQGFYRLSASAPAVGSTTRITGYGSAQGTMNLACKTHTGPSTLVGGVTGTQIAYTVDTTGGNSGSPVVDEAAVTVYGVHSHAGCNGSGGANNGTVITHPGIQAHYAQHCIPVAPSHALSLTQAGPGAPLLFLVTNAPPSSELFNIVSFTPASPTDTGTFFGLWLGPGSGDPLPLFALPLGTHPFHVLADAAGNYALLIGTNAPGIVFSCDLVSLAFEAGTNFTTYHGRSPAVHVTFSL